MFKMWKSLYVGQNLGSLHHTNDPNETVSVSLHMNVCAGPFFKVLDKRHVHFD